MSKLLVIVLCAIICVSAVNCRITQNTLLADLNAARDLAKAKLSSAFKTLEMAEMGISMMGGEFNDLYDNIIDNNKKILEAATEFKLDVVEHIKNLTIRADSINISECLNLSLDHLFSSVSKTVSMLTNSIIDRAESLPNYIQILDKARNTTVQILKNIEYEIEICGNNALFPLNTFKAIVCTKRVGAQTKEASAILQGMRNKLMWVIQDSPAPFAAQHEDDIKKFNEILRLSLSETIKCIVEKVDEANADYDAKQPKDLDSDDINKILNNVFDESKLKNVITDKSLSFP